jgi:hypothetical protein
MGEISEKSPARFRLGFSSMSGNLQYSIVACGRGGTCRRTLFDSRVLRPTGSSRHLRIDERKWHCQGKTPRPPLLFQSSSALNAQKSHFPSFRGLTTLSSFQPILSRDPSSILYQAQYKRLSNRGTEYSRAT